MSKVYNKNNSNKEEYSQMEKNNYGQEEADRVSIGSWIFTIIVLAIPIVNVIYFICLLLGLGLQPKVSLVRATLLLSIIGFGISFGILCFRLGSVDAAIGIYKEFFLLLIELLKRI